VLQGFAGQALNIAFATSVVLPAISALFQWAFPWVQIPGQKAVQIAVRELLCPEPMTKNERRAAGCIFLLNIFTSQSVEFSILCIQLHSIIDMTTITKER